MGIGKIARNSALVAGGVVAGTVGLAGYGIYKLIHGTKHFVLDFYHRPSLKKTFAVAVIPFAIYGIRHPTGAVEGVSKAFHGSGVYFSKTLNEWNDARVKSMGEKLEENKGVIGRLEAQNKNLERIIYSETHAKAQARPAESRPSGARTGREYIDGFAGSFKNMIYVDKDKNEVHLLRSSGKNYVESGKYYCTTGKNPLPKAAEGDRASPEGIFYAKPEEFEWNSSYVPAKLRLLIPQSMGNGIVVAGTYDHGINDAILKHDSVSNGGIILSSADYLDLHQKIGADPLIPIVIAGRHTKTLMDYTRGVN